MSVTAPELETVSVDLGARSYDILVGHGALAELGPRLLPMLKQKRVFVLTDEHVEAAHRARVEAVLSASGITSSWLALTPGEKTKTFSNLEAILDWLLEGGADRSDILVALGGGVIGDIAGLSANLMKRGMGFVQVPTTLLAQVDSSVGGKTAVNSPRGKNLIGAFYQPRLVIADTELLATLPARELRAGYAEIVKYGLINDPAFFDWLEANGARVLALEADAITYAVAVSCRAKAAIVAEDETEKGVRALLNLGHTFGHALEAANNYRPDLLHGEAVAIGMALAFRYGAATGHHAGGRCRAGTPGAGSLRTASGHSRPAERGVYGQRTRPPDATGQEGQRRESAADSRPRHRTGIHSSRCRPCRRGRFPTRRDT
jgi:3-dehydroquinate synthase